MAMMERQMKFQNQESFERIDQISAMPDEVLCLILSFLPTKLVISTSIISSRWTNLWTFLPVLDFECHGIPTYSFINTIEKVLRVNSSLNLEKLCLKISYGSWIILPLVNNWVKKAAECKVVDLDVQLFDSTKSEDHGGLALHIPPCDSLKLLKIRGGFGLHMPTLGCFDGLRKFDVHLNDPDNELLAKLFCSLPQLAELSVKGIFSKKDSVIFINISAPNLKRLSLSTKADNYYDFDFMIVIDAPLLEHIFLSDKYLASSYTVKNQPALVEATIDVGNMCLDDYDNLSYDPSIELLEGLSNAKSLTLYDGSVLALDYASEETVIPWFPYLTKLSLVDFYLHGFTLLLKFLKRVPNLKVLIIEVVHDIDNEDLIRAILSEGSWNQLEPLPECFFHLEEIEILCSMSSGEEEFLMEFIYCFMRNAKVLKNLSVDGDYFVKNGVRQ